MNKTLNFQIGIAEKTTNVTWCIPKTNPHLLGFWQSAFAFICDHSYCYLLCSWCYEAIWKHWFSASAFYICNKKYLLNAEECTLSQLEGSVVQLILWLIACNFEAHATFVKTFVSKAGSDYYLIVNCFLLYTMHKALCIIIFVHHSTIIKWTIKQIQTASSEISLRCCVYCYDH